MPKSRGKSKSPEPEKVLLRTLSRIGFGFAVIVVIGLMSYAPAVLANKGDAPQQYGPTKVENCKPKSSYSECLKKKPSCKKVCKCKKRSCKPAPKPAPAPTPVPETPVPPPATSTPEPTPPTPVTPPVVTIGQPSVSVDKSGPAFVRSGKFATYVVVVRNNGNVAVRNAVLKDIYPDRLKLVDSSVAGRTVATRVLAIKIPELAPGGSFVVKFRFQAGISGPPVKNRARVDIPGITVPFRDEVTTTIVAAPSIPGRGSGKPQKPGNPGVVG